MKLRERGTTSTLILVAALLLLLPLLAVLQYRWLAQLSEREQEHMKSNLQRDATRFSQDFDEELTRVYVALSPPPELEKEEGLAAYAAQCIQWQRIAQYPRLVRDVLVGHTDEQGQLHLHQLMADTSQFVPCDWPSELSILQQQLKENLKSDSRTAIRELMGRRFQELNEETAAFIHPILLPPTVTQRGQIALPAPAGLIIITISLPEVQQVLLPSLAKRDFTGAIENDYSVTIVTRSPERKVIYQLGPEAPRKKDADITVNLMGLRREGLRPMMGRFLSGRGVPFRMPEPPPPGKGTPPDGAPHYGPPHAKDGAPPPPRAGAGMPPIGNEQKLWELRLTHRAGSLEAAVVSIRRRNLLISFGILVLLAASIALLILSARRAERLARQQMDFVAGVSHELRTPLAVIKSAAWNLTRGVIREEEQIKRYSMLIGKESDRLIEMIEQVLEFAGTRSGNQKFELQPTSVPELIDNVLDAAQPLFTEGNFQIEKNVASDLPLVMADAPALARALRNLMDNAIKYSGDNRWIGVRAESTRKSRKAEVRITVSDRGLGIPPEELTYIFEPFWRGSEATGAQIHGNGLGLNLVRTIIQAHGGSIDVRSTPGKGSSFTLSLPSIAQNGHEPATIHSPIDTGAAS